MLAPADPKDVLDLGLHGIALSHFCGLWTGLTGGSVAIVERILRVRTVALGRARAAVADGAPVLAYAGAGWRHPGPPACRA